MHLPLGAAGTPDSDIDAYFVDAGKFIIGKRQSLHRNASKSI